MPEVATGNPSLTIAVALAAGIITQAIAHHLRVPGIVLLLLVGVCLGPDGLGIVQPATLGGGLHLLVGFAVAIILFEGGMSLNLGRIQRESRTIRQFITIGALVTAVGGAIAARIFTDWDWRVCILFGTLVIVTGPTVISPLLKRWKVKRTVATVLEAEGVLIDAIGAICAVVALEVIFRPTGESLAKGIAAIISGLAFGSLVGLLGGVALGAVLRFRNLIPEGLEKVFTLSIVLALFQASNSVFHESGIAAVTVAGIVVGNARFHVLKDLHAFKEELTVLLIGLLFVLLAADVRIAEVIHLGSGGLFVVAALMFVIRPLNVLAGTWGSALTWKEMFFIGWISPRGIIAAAVASLFAGEMARANIPGGNELRALVFLVIAVTVVFSAVTGGLLATLLDLRRPSGKGWVILGANPLGRTLAHALNRRGEETLLIDSNDEACNEAEAEGLKVLYANALDDRTLKRAEIDIRSGALGLTRNEEVNLLFVTKARHACSVGHFATTLRSAEESITTEMVHDAGCQVLFGRPRDVEAWSQRLRDGVAALEDWELDPGLSSIGGYHRPLDRSTEDLVVPLIVVHRGRVLPVDDATPLRPGAVATFAIHSERESKAHACLSERGWRPLEARE